MSRKLGRIVALVIVLAVGVNVLLSDHAVCDGFYDVTVQLAPDYNPGATSLSYICCHDSEEADAVLQSLDDRLAVDATNKPSVAPFDIQTGVSWRRSLGYTWGYYRQYSEIVLVLHRADGTRVVHRLPIPDRKESRQIVVTAASAL
jgi:hypothetical protein